MDSCGTPCPSCQASGVVTRKLSVLSIIPAAPKLPTAEARGANGFAAIKDPKVICMTPTIRASFCAPSFSRSREKLWTRGDQRLRVLDLVLFELQCPNPQGTCRQPTAHNRESDGS